MEKAEAVEEAVRLFLTEPPSLTTGTPADEARERAFALGATWDDINAEELRQRAQRPR
ncbi:hypothetical protein AB0H77_21865 [Streptomyces sp. NPDC050844]|uniref:hypothetical protein n=1 Tax=Streptomyces sp. NPDC050844 TaxID=3155790 RepID=UPI0033CE4646